MLAEQLCDVDPSVLYDDEKLAFFLNLYNALLLHVGEPQATPQDCAALLCSALLCPRVCYAVHHCPVQDCTASRLETSYGATHRPPHFSQAQ